MVAGKSDCKREALLQVLMSVNQGGIESEHMRATNHHFLP